MKLIKIDGPEFGHWIAGSSNLGAQKKTSQPEDVGLHRLDGRQQCEHFYGTHTDRQCVLTARYDLEIEDGSVRQYCRQHYEAHMPPITVLDRPLKT